VRGLCVGEFWLFYIFRCGCLSRLVKMEMCQNVQLCALAFLVEVSTVLETRGLVAYNDLQLQEVGDFEAQNCMPPLYLIRSTKLQLTTEPPISCRCCYAQYLNWSIVKFLPSKVSLLINPMFCFKSSIP
jgi:hypothetical protein